MAVYNCFLVLQCLVNFLSFIYDIPKRLKGRILGSVFDDNFSRFGIVSLNGNKVIKLIDYETASLFYLMWIWLSFHTGHFRPPMIGFTESDEIKYYFWTIHRAGKVQHGISHMTPLMVETAASKQNNTIMYAILNNKDITALFKSYMSSLLSANDITLSTFARIALEVDGPYKLQIMDSECWVERVFENDDVLAL